MHNLEMLEDGTASMFSGEGIMPWHGLVTPVEGVLTAEEALKAAHLDWEVEKRQSYYPVYELDEDGQTVEKLVPDPGKYKAVRMSDQKSLGEVSDQYRIFQNRQVFSFFDAVTGSGEAKYTAAGSINGGRRIFLTAKIGDTFTVCGEEEHNLYLLMSNTHDATQSFVAAATAVRAVCDNTVTLGINSAVSKWTLRHKSDLKGKVAEARNSLQMSYSYIDAFQREVEKMMEIQVTKDQFNRIAETIIEPSKFQHDKAVAGLMDVFENEKTVNDTNAKGTAWGAYNAVTYWTDWVRNYQTPSSRFKSLVDGGFADSTRNKAHKKLLALG